MSALAEHREARDVLRRHDKAMSVVDQVDDADARWALLRYVLLGTASVENAFQGIRRGGREGRSAQIVSLRDDAGWTFTEIAHELGYRHKSGPQHVYARGIRSVA